ncbi:hypothetical protein BC834DRAFT_490885 [Gloeopeniophorella convolvens]|nr:hypothetical protein BC834DRAFT_490885 [Gloeopeniophorella convolvens]
MIEGVARYSEDWEIRKAQKLDSWLRNMTRLSGLINLLEKLASSAAPERRPGVNRQVHVLRSSLKKQQERYIEFLQLSRDYADKFLLDISSTIIGQEEFLDTLEKRWTWRRSCIRKQFDCKSHMRARSRVLWRISGKQFCLNRCHRTQAS